MTTPSTPEQVLQNTMAKLEAALLAPPIAGEMGIWVHEVTNAAATLATDWTRELNSILHPQCEQIAQSDPEMSAYVQRLTESGQDLFQELANFLVALRRLENATSHVDWQEGKLAAQQKQLETAGLQLILRMKKQQVAAASGMSEAIYRDRGVND